MLSKNPGTINTYSCFDTAAAYGSERGLIKSRDEVFITSKLWCNCNHHDLVLPALNNALQKLGMEYVDLYLVHFSLRLKKEVASFEFAKEDILPSWDMKGTWEAMEECCRLGLAKSIGVSNFSCKKLSQLLQYATIPPVVNQVEMNAAWQQVKLREFCREKGIHVSAWSPLGANGAIWGSLAVVENPLLKEISAAKGKSLAQLR
ncbi:Methylecgonone reductase [Vitis vinifera]|uniref:Methylecgonone reductase n=1 Tax=Vitis vinifera TaxID=29760 RepID=A0A438IR42_VITVI|nr:Methylecgonone reductase [Vitis vinifera]